MGGGGGIGGLVGGGLGFLAGGPVGAAIGAGIGMGAGSALGGGNQAPAAPDYTGAAQATAQGNLDAARAAAAANRVNQITPYGNLTYRVSGSDPFGNPTWTATQTLAPAQQRLLDIQNELSIGQGELGKTGLKYVGEQLANPFDVSKLPSIGINPSETYSDAIMRRLAPTLQQQNEQLEQQLANQGIPVGSEAYNRAKMSLSQRQNDLMLGAQTQGLQAGLSARQQQLGELAYRRNEPLNILNALRSGAQVTGPSYVNTPQQATTAGADLLAANQMGYNAQMGAYNAQQAQQANLMGGLFGLGAAGLMGGYSDPRTKENIKAIGVMENGLTLYSFEYKDEFKDRSYGGHGVHVGVMADEVEQVYPYAVRTLDDGYKVVDYGLIP
jgi:hypothetical protein